MSEPPVHHHHPPAAPGGSPGLYILAGVGLASMAGFCWMILSQFVALPPAPGRATVATPPIPASPSSLPALSPVSRPDAGPAVITAALPATAASEGLAVWTPASFSGAPEKPEASKREKKVLEDLAVASVHFGDMPYLILKSGERVYPGAHLAAGLKLEAIGPNSLILSTPGGLYKLPSNHPVDALVLPTELLPESLPLPDLGTFVDDPVRP
jgi:hypothetical protein